MAAYSDKGITLNLNDRIVLTAPEDDSGFFRSHLGKCFAKGVCDEVELVVRRREWLEYYFECKLYKNGIAVTSNEYYSKMFKGQESYDLTEIYSESCGYPLLRYVLSKGGVISNKDS